MSMSCEESANKPSSNMWYPLEKCVTELQKQELPHLQETNGKIYYAKCF